MLAYAWTKRAITGFSVSWNSNVTCGVHSVAIELLLKLYVEASHHRSYSTDWSLDGVFASRVVNYPG